MVWLGVSSPPSVRAVPVKREVGPRKSSPPGLGVFLTGCISILKSTAWSATYFCAFLMIFFLSFSAALGFSTAKPDFSPPAYRSGLSSSLGSKSSSSSSSSPWPWPAWLGPPPPPRSPRVANFFFGACVADGCGGMLEGVGVGCGPGFVAAEASGFRSSSSIPSERLKYSVTADPNSHELFARYSWACHSNMSA